MTEEKKPDFTDSEPDARVPSHIRHARVLIDGVEVARFKDPPKLIPHAELKKLGIVDAISESMEAEARRQRPLTREQDSFKRLTGEGLSLTVKQLAPFTRIPLAGIDMCQDHLTFDPKTGRILTRNGVKVKQPYQPPRLIPRGE